MSDIFISYATEERNRIQPLVNALQKTGWSVFWDRTIPAGKTWRQVIGSEIRTCRSVLVVWTESSISSEWVLEEAETGKRRQILIPVLLDIVDPPFGFGRIQAANLAGWNGDSSSPTFNRLVVDISSLLGPAPVVATEADHQRYPQAISQRNAEGGRLREQKRRQSEEEAQLKTYEQSRRSTTTRDHVFICYAREDEAFVLQLGKNLKGRGVPVWLDQWDIPPGSDWDQSIDNAIYDCAKFIIVLSSRAVESTEVRGELRTALDENKRIIPVIHASCRLPRQLRTIQHVDFTSTDPNDEAALTRLLRTLATSTAAPDVAQQVDATDRKRSMREAVRQEPESELKPSTFFSDKLRDGSKGPQMVVIPAGTFKMGDIQGTGDNNEKPVHTVVIPKSFAIGRYPITCDEYDRFASTTARYNQGRVRGRLPAMNMSWRDAVEYAEWLSGQTGKWYRLPTEAEWEYAARGGTETDYWWGNQIGAMANFASGHRPSTVGDFKPNPFGLYDTAGNVWEWVEDCWHGTYQGAPEDGSAWLEANGGNCGQRVTRGGSWADRPDDLRVSFRSWGTADTRHFLIGFRLAQDLD